MSDRPLRRTLTGVGNYIAQLLLNFPEFAPLVRVCPFIHTHLSRQDWRERLKPPPLRPDVAPPPSAQKSGDHHPGDVGENRKAWWMRRLMQGGYAFLLRQYSRGYDLVHEPNHIPVACRKPIVTTIHDLSGIVHPEWHPADRVAWYEREFPEGVKRTTRFLAASEFTKREMIARLGVRAERIDVFYQAPRAAFAPQSRESVGVTLRDLQLPESFFLYVGTLEPRKNVVGLLEAYAGLPDALRRRHPLMVVGAWGWKQQALRAKLEEHGLSRDVRLLGYMYDRELAALYTACTALVWPSFYEGFGLPPLEAMACGAAAIVSDAASLPEVVGDAGVQLPPAQVTFWTDAMRRMAEDEAWREERRALSLQQAARFTWRACIERTESCYRAALAT